MSKKKNVNSPNIISNNLDQVSKVGKYYEEEVLIPLMNEIIKAFDNMDINDDHTENKELSENFTELFDGLGGRLKDSLGEDKKVMEFIEKLLQDIASPQGHTTLLHDDLLAHPRVNEILASYFKDLKDNISYTDDQKYKLNQFYDHYSNIIQKRDAKEQAEKENIKKDQQKAYRKAVMTKLLNKLREKMKQGAQFLINQGEDILYKGGGSSKFEVDSHLIDKSGQRTNTLLTGANDIKKDGVLLLGSLAIPSAILGIAVSQSLHYDSAIAATIAGLTYYILMYANDSKAIRQLSLDKFSNLPDEKNIFKKIGKSGAVGGRIALILVTSWFAADYAKGIMFSDEANRALTEKITKEVEILEKERDDKIDNKTVTLKGKEQWIQTQKEDLRDEIKNGRNGRGSGYGENAKETERILREEENKFKIEKQNIDVEINDIKQDYEEKIESVKNKYTGFFEKIKALDDLMKKEKGLGMKVHAIMIMLLLLELIPLLSKMRKTQNSLWEKIVGSIEKDALLEKNEKMQDILKTIEQDLYTTEQINAHNDKNFIADLVSKRLLQVTESAINDISKLESDVTIPEDMKTTVRNLIRKATDTAEENITK